MNGYQTWRDSLSQRKEVIYAGSNSGILHAFDAETGVEKWGFVPPLIAPTLPLVMNSNLNLPGGGGTNAIFGVDGSIVHDMYLKRLILQKSIQFYLPHMEEAVLV